MEIVTCLSIEEVEKMYPKDSSPIAKIAHETINSGLNVAVIESSDFYGDFDRMVRICMSAIENKSCFNRMKYVIDFCRGEQAAVIAYDAKCNT